MRLQLSKILKQTDYLLHADMWNTKNFTSKARIINVGLGESNLLNIAGGIASEKNTVYIYSVGKHFGAKHGKIIICNAGSKEWYLLYTIRKR